MNSSTIVVIIVVILFILIFLPQTIKIVQQWERGVVYRLGIPNRVRGPGLFFTIPIIEKALRVDIRNQTFVSHLHNATSKDNAAISGNAVIKYRIIDPMAVVVQSETYTRDAEKLFTDRLLDFLKQYESRELAYPDSIGNALQQSLNREIQDRGLEVTEVKLEDLSVSPFSA